MLIFIVHMGVLSRLLTGHLTQFQFRIVFEKRKSETRTKCKCATLAARHTRAYVPQILYGASISIANKYLKFQSKLCPQKRTEVVAAQWRCSQWQKAEAAVEM